MNDLSQRKQIFEISWEACNQVGGIYSVLRSKAPHMVEAFLDHYCLIGPYLNSKVESEFESIDVDSLINNRAIVDTIKCLRGKGHKIEIGRWSVTGKPLVVLLSLDNMYSKLPLLKYYMWKDHYIECDSCYDPIIDQVLAFGEMIKIFLFEYAKRVNNGDNASANTSARVNTIAHFHEWMSATPIPALRLHQIPITTIFTTHATSLGRYLSLAGHDLYNNLDKVNWEQESRNFNILTQVKIERAAAHGSHIFTTVSAITSSECEYLINRKPDYLLPNGLNIERFVAIHELQNLHKKFKDKIHEFTIGHFFHNYSFDLDKTLYFFTSGRFEYRNKGFDITLDALTKLNQMLRQAPELSDMTVVMFIITRQPFYSINPLLFHQRAMTEKLRSACDDIIKQIGETLFFQIAGLNRWEIPNLNKLIDEYHWLKLKRVLHAWKKDDLPLIVTHTLQNQNDEILTNIRANHLLNYREDRVKIVYQPDFVSPLNPINQNDYNQFVRGCNLGIFPSYYEPWGLTPVESLALGTPSVTSNLSGFGEYVLQNIAYPEKKGLYVLNRKDGNYLEQANTLAKILFSFCLQSRRERIHQRNLLEALSMDFDWSKMIKNYLHVYSAIT